MDLTKIAEEGARQAKGERWREYLGAAWIRVWVAYQKGQRDPSLLIEQAKLGAIYAEEAKRSLVAGDLSVENHARTVESVDWHRADEASVGLWAEMKPYRQRYKLINRVMLYLKLVERVPVTEIAKTFGLSCGACRTRMEYVMRAVGIDMKYAANGWPLRTVGRNYHARDTESWGKTGRRSAY